MLELKNIHKVYAAGPNQVQALRGIDLQFRKSEFVSILGPSGCGKTTMLNIIGGLDQYSDGDLVIDGVSTKHYKDRQWDTYRNHSVGFVFQNYNLIPHQTVLSNVELALTLSGVSRKQRRERAKKALEQVGLADQLNKLPGEMSGGQMQRVAIARALVNNPDIILADEPTGALDTQTSVQVMEILKEISKSRLVIMVTHNPELAETYSTRIIRMLDGKIIGDSMPLTQTELEEAEKMQKPGKPEKARKPSMSLWTAFNLSLKNLFTKKGRTVLTSFAGSIGIIGIALIYAVSQGMSTYINTVQEETLASYPLTLEATTISVSTLIESFMGVAENNTEHELDGVYSKSVLTDLFNAFNNMESTENDLNAFKQKVEQEMKDPNSALYNALSGVQYTYDLDLLVYTKAVDGNIIYSNTEEMLTQVFSKNMGSDMSGMMNMRDQMTGAMGMPTTATANVQLWNEMLPGKDGSMISSVLKGQYNLVQGDWPNSAEEIVLVVDKNYELDDLTLYALGLKPQAQMHEVFDKVMNGEQVENTQEKWTFQEIMDMEFRVVYNSQCFVYDEALGRFADLRDTEAGLRYLYDNAMKLRVSGIITPNPEATGAMLKGSIGYTQALTKHVLKQLDNSTAVKTQMENPETDILTGLPFADDGKMTEQEKEEKFRSFVSGLVDGEKAKAYVKIMSIPSQEVIDEAVAFGMRDATREKIEETLVMAMSQQMSVDLDEVKRYISEMEDDELNAIYAQMIETQVRTQTATRVQMQMASVPNEQLAQMLDEAMKTYTAAQCAMYYDEIIEFSDSTYEHNLQKLGYVDEEYPATMNLFASNFENKDVIEEFIAEYNDSVDELKKIEYTDYMGLMMASVTTIIDAITYALIGFVAISLVVSSIMIGVITLISVQERTKEIGILRAIGASKHNVSSMFNAETVIIGCISGLIGVGTTYLLCFPLNAVVFALTGLAGLRAYLPWQVAAVLVAISMLLTLISGIIPSRSAAKKDPVVALRTE